MLDAWDQGQKLHIEQQRLHCVLGGAGEIFYFLIREWGIKACRVMYWYRAISSATGR